MLTIASRSPWPKGFVDYCSSVEDTFFQVEFALKDADRPFVSKFETRRFGAIEITRAFATSRLTGRRRRELLSPNAPDQFVLNIVQSGLVRCAQFGRVAETPPRHMFLADARAPFESEQITTTSALYLRIPGVRLREAVGAPEDYCAVAYDARSGLNAAFSDFLFALWRERDALSEEEKSAVADRVVDFLALACKPVVAPAISPNEALRRKMERYITMRVSDPMLSVDNIAKSLGVSRSRLYAALREKEESIGERILAIRLERCREALRDPRFDHLKIINIAFECGFSDAAHFSRAFKRKFGMTPRSYRRQRVLTP